MDSLQNTVSNIIDDLRRLLETLSKELHDCGQLSPEMTQEVLERHRDAAAAIRKEKNAVELTAYEDAPAEAVAETRKIESRWVRFLALMYLLQGFMDRNDRDGAELVLDEVEYHRQHDPVSGEWDRFISCDWMHRLSAEVIELTPRASFLWRGMGTSDTFLTQHFIDPLLKNPDYFDEQTKGNLLSSLMDHARNFPIIGSQKIEFEAKRKKHFLEAMRVLVVRQGQTSQAEEMTEILWSEKRKYFESLMAMFKEMRKEDRVAEARSDMEEAYRDFMEFDSLLDDPTVDLDDLDDRLIAAYTEQTYDENTKEWVSNQQAVPKSFGVREIAAFLYYELDASEFFRKPKCFKHAVAHLVESKQYDIDLAQLGASFVLLLEDISINENLLEAKLNTHKAERLEALKVEDPALWLLLSRVSHNRITDILVQGAQLLDLLERPKESLRWCKYSRNRMEKLLVTDELSYLQDASPSKFIYLSALEHVLEPRQQSENQLATALDALIKHGSEDRWIPVLCRAILVLAVSPQYCGAVDVAITTIAQKIATYCLAVQCRQYPTAVVDILRREGKEALASRLLWSIMGLSQSQSAAYVDEMDQAVAVDARSAFTENVIRRAGKLAEIMINENFPRNRCDGFLHLRAVGKLDLAALVILKGDLQDVWEVLPVIAFDFYDAGEIDVSWQYCSLALRLTDRQGGFPGPYEHSVCCLRLAQGFLNRKRQDVAASLIERCLHRTDSDLLKSELGSLMPAAVLTYCKAGGWEQISRHVDSLTIGKTGPGQPELSYLVWLAEGLSSWDAAGPSVEKLAQAAVVLAEEFRFHYSSCGKFCLAARAVVKTDASKAQDLLARAIEIFHRARFQGELPENLLDESENPMWDDTEMAYALSEMADALLGDTDGSLSQYHADSCRELANLLVFVRNSDSRTYCMSSICKYIARHMDWEEVHTEIFEKTTAQDFRRALLTAFLEKYAAVECIDGLISIVGLLPYTVESWDIAVMALRGVLHAAKEVQPGVLRAIFQTCNQLDLVRAVDLLVKSDELNVCIPQQNGIPNWCATGLSIAPELPANARTQNDTDLGRFLETLRKKLFQPMSDGCFPSDRFLQRK